jgi:putative membrane protein
LAKNRELLVLLALLVAGTTWSWIEPFDRLTWWLEALPVLIATPVLIVTRNRFPLTRLVYYLIFMHALILLLGAHYTYARVPLGFWLQDLLEFSRNPYDRIGHIAQGFVPAMVAREIFIRHQIIRSRAWLFFLVVCFCLAFSAFYELIEWWVAVVGGDGSVEFLGTQGDVWDAQWDMMLALLGAIAALTLLGRTQDRQLAGVDKDPTRANLSAP